MSAVAPSLSFEAERPSLRGWIVMGWAAFGFVALLVDALVRLGGIAWQSVSGGEFRWWHGVSLLVWVVAMGYMEGYRGFQLRFSPRFAARALWLAKNPTLGRSLLAPFFCMGLFQATRRVLLVSWGVLVGVVLLVIAIRQLDQPWRGIIDGGVVVGLGWGLMASVFWLVQAARGRPLPSGPELP